MMKVARTVCAMVAVGDLIGQLSVDLIFDTGRNLDAFRSYYCVLLASLSQFPQLIRVAAPCLVLTVSGSWNVLCASRNSGDLAAAAVAIFGGLVAFSRSVSIVEGLCAATTTTTTTEKAAAQTSLARWHFFIGVVLAATLACLSLSLRRDHLAATTTTPEQKKKT